MAIRHEPPRRGRTLARRRERARVSDAVRVSTAHGVATLTLNRPAVLNALDPAMAAALAAATGDLAARADVRCIVVTGAGAHFMAGGDIGYFASLLSMPPDERVRRVAAIIGPVHDSIRNLAAAPQPVIASVRGACAGFGLSLMLACDLAVVSRAATLSLAYCRIGASPDGGCTHALPRLTGLRRAMEIALLGDRFTAEDAAAMGLVNRLCDDGELEAVTAELSRRLAAGPGRTLARTKRLLRASLDNALDVQLAAEEESFLRGVAGAEFAEGVTAFVEKRPPDFPRDGR